MFDWFKKAAPEKVEAAPSTAFSTDVLIPNPLKRALFLENSIRKSFQAGPALAAVNSAGVAMDSIAMDDSFSSSIKAVFANVRATIPDAQVGWFGSQGFIGYQMCAMISQNWLVDKACGTPARDAVRTGYDITVNDGVQVDPKVIDAMRAADKRMGLNKNLVQAARMNRVFGVRVIIFKVLSDDPEYYAKPFNPDGVKPGSYLGISQVDPYWIAPVLDELAASDPAAMEFYEPTWWIINARRYHRSHLVILRGSEVPDVLKPSYLFGGISIPQKIAERVYAAERTANEAPMLAMTKRMTVLKMDLALAMADKEKFQDRMEAWSYLMNNHAVKVIGAADDVNQYDTTLSDLDDVIMTQYQLVCAASEVPATKLLGTAPQGLNATGEYDESSYHEMLESIQEHELTPIIDRHHLLLIRSEIAPSAPFETTVVWKPLNSVGGKELADINYQNAQAGALLFQTGAIDGQDERNRLIADPNSGYSGLPAIAPQEFEEEGSGQGTADPESEEPNGQEQNTPADQGKDPVGEAVQDK